MMVSRVPVLAARGFMFIMNEVPQAGLPRRTNPVAINSQYQSLTSLPGTRAAPARAGQWTCRNRLAASPDAALQSHGDLHDPLKRLVGRDHAKLNLGTRRRRAGGVSGRTGGGRTAGGNRQAFEHRARSPSRFGGLSPGQSPAAMR